MDESAIRRRLAGAQGERYWRCLDELADSEAFREFVRGRFRADVPPATDPIRRRQFLAMLGAMLGLAGLNGCRLQPPEQEIVPYVRAPEEIVPGEPSFFATAVPASGGATGLLIENNEGRPTKVEGNQFHPGSLGATDVFAQAAVLTLYDPGRSQAIRSYRPERSPGEVRTGQIRSWGEFLTMIRTAMAAQQDKQGAGLYLLTETIGSPTLAAQLDLLHKQYPRMHWHQWEPAGDDAARQGARLAFGRFVNTYYRFDRATTILSLGADFLGAGPGRLRYARDFIDRRKAAVHASSGAGADAAPSEMNRLYVVEPTPTVTGAKADHRWRVAAREMAGFARAVAARIDDSLKAAVGAAEAAGPVPEAWVDALAADLRQHLGTSIVIAGREQPADVHLLAHAMNHALGNVGKTVIHTDPLEAGPTIQVESLRGLVDAMDAGAVELLVILGGNPVYTAPADLEFGKRLAARDESGRPRVPLRVHMGLYEDETAGRCDWHVNEAHWLEAWSDARALDGTASVIQPLIAPLYDGKTTHDVVFALAGRAERLAYEEVRGTWRSFWEQTSAARTGVAKTDDGKGDPAGFEDYWWTALNRGVIEGTTFEPVEVSLKGDWAGGLSPTGSPGASDFEILFRPDPAVHDGRFANNGWLQELPQPLTRLTWGNAALLSPAAAEQLGLSTTPAGHGGPHGEVLADVVELHYRGRVVEAPAWIVPGQADSSVTLTLGHGRELPGLLADGVGFNAYTLRTSDAPWFDSGLQIVVTGRKVPMACTQYHQVTEGRDLVRSGTIGQYRDHPDEVAAPHEEPGRAPSAPPPGVPGVTPVPGERPVPSLYPGYAYNGYRWGMAIDMTACVGCNACVIACQAENNIPVVGKDQVFRGREMHWIRIDTYHKGTADSPETWFQPVPCMQCENAPCEYVCPVAATVHSYDGLNDMVYNRCVGTRYCSNNCPYKVRRFNFLQFADYTTEPMRMVYNPEVTVRSRGVMEKCSYCVQRIRRAQIAAEKEGRRVRDGEVLTACQAACPTRAISFGDLNDETSTVLRWKRSPLNYVLLAELDTSPRTSYLAAIRNPNPQIHTA
jgi:MoCo/4Fe-4S cofactor protein with predicted Tat translocation signal